MGKGAFGKVYLANTKDKSMMTKQSIEDHTVDKGIQSMFLSSKEHKDKTLLQDITKDLSEQ